MFLPSRLADSPTVGEMSPARTRPGCRGTLPEDRVVDNWVFVTGMIRSGTTFLATILTHPWSVDYIHEPFNGGYILPERIDLRPRYVRPGNTSETTRRYRSQLLHLFDYSIGMHTAKYDGDPLHRRAMKKLVGSRGPFYLRMAKVNPLHRHTVIKDPMAGLTTEFLYREFGVKPVIIIRHPVSLAASLQRLGWFPQVYDFILQPNIVDDYLATDRDLLERSYPNRMMEAMAHWRLLHKVLLDQAERYGDWLVVTHEALSAEPQRTFRRIYQHTGLPWTDNVARKIDVLTKGNDKVAAAPGRVQDFKRESASIFAHRRDSIDVNVRRDIYELTAAIADRLYDRSTFSLDA
jgi:hypothetical protein